ncbi:glycosyltransferase family 1 protein [Vineibacter terrae]|uniref:Glycosyltransferase family 1 protein n=1 Tax=Vineibacter terrae TaxID=2586908 RepID=A0A5C8PHP7_9HYPH|nr:glycosyltransferase family 1 protein [Vineibacter terrae]TXL72833.1 glycosyltransferase family 1 protein [Vineibacter terrae]
MRIAIVTDAWLPQVNGVVRTLDTVRGELVAMGHEVEMFGPDRFRTWPCPTYPEIRLALLPARRLASLLAAFAPEAIHIATEGPLGIAARRLCVRRKLPFTTAYHTRFPEYVRARFLFPTAWTYAIMRRFHGPSSGIMVSTDSIRSDLAARGFRNIRPWTRGVDLELFHPRPPGATLQDGDRPIWLYVGRVAVEKNIEAFLALDLPGRKWVVGGGPLLPKYVARYPNIRFTGQQQGEQLAALYRAADVFVFPSRTDTFGLVLLEALASGLPVAAYPVPGPRDVIGNAPVGALNDDLRAAALMALDADRAACRAHAARYSWRHTAEVFFANLVPLPAPETVWRAAAPQSAGSGSPAPNRA